MSSPDHCVLAPPREVHHQGWLVKSPPLERAGHNLFKAVRERESGAFLSSFVSGSRCQDMLSSFSYLATLSRHKWRLSLLILGVAFRLSALGQSH